MPRILFVRDDALNQLSLESWLIEAGHHLIATTSLDRALALIASDPFGLVIADCVAPTHERIATLLQIHRQDEERPMLLLTVHPAPDGTLGSVPKAFVASVFDCLALPLARHRLLRAVELAAARYTLVGRIRQLEEVNRSQAAVLAQHERRGPEQQRASALLVHDLKNPLAAVITGLSFLEKTPEILERPDLRGCVADCEQAALAALRMIAMLLDIERLEASRLPHLLEKVHFSTVVRRCAQVFKLIAEDRGVSVEVDVPEDLWVHVDPTLMERIVGNLLSNALRYVPRKDGFVRVAAERDRSHWAFTIENNGPSIPPALKSRLFDKYSQAGPDGENTSITYGLGLYFCSLAAHAHGGVIRVEDRTAGGVRFRIELPMSRREA